MWFSKIKEGDVKYVSQNMTQNVCIRDENEMTGLMWACSYISDEHLRIVQLLAQREQGLQTKQGMSALMFSAIVNNVSAIDMLRDEAGMSDQNGYTAFAWSYFARSKEFAKCIVDNFGAVEQLPPKTLEEVKLPKAVQNSIKALRKTAREFKSVNQQQKIERYVDKLEPKFNDFPDVFDTKFYANDLNIVEDVSLLSLEEFVELNRAEEQIKAALNGLDVKITGSDKIFNIVCKKYGEIAKNWR
ncbi:Ankyrin_repeat protein 1 [Hexamita inflata]|uniref:Ankyrin repeat protein 1 n=1 Tax=Hexamita inflata TaxID=28002 RepID=A0AA86QWT6_9EUKA|nr:Ankyrin repeat protein 1 [Hexamita inflata]